MRKIIFVQGSRADLRKALRKTKSGYGDLALRKFENDVFRKLSLAAENPMLFQASKGSKEIRRIVMHQPYKIYYEWDDVEIRVVAIVGSRTNYDI